MQVSKPDFLRFCRFHRFRNLHFTCFPGFASFKTGFWVVLQVSQVSKSKDHRFCKFCTFCRFQNLTFMGFAGFTGFKTWILDVLQVSQVSKPDDHRFCKFCTFRRFQNPLSLGFAGFVGLAPNVCEFCVFASLHFSMQGLQIFWASKPYYKTLQLRRYRFRKFHRFSTIDCRFAIEAHKLAVLCFAASGIICFCQRMLWLEACFNTKLTIFSSVTRAQPTHKQCLHHCFPLALVLKHSQSLRSGVESDFQPHCAFH